MKKTELNLTSGNLFWKVPIFVLPLMMTTIFQLLYTTVDLWTVSSYGGGLLSMTAIGSNSALINMIITVLASLATGANVCISIAKGKGDQTKANRILHTALIIAFIGGIIFAIFGFFMSPLFLKWMDINSCYLSGMKDSTPPAIITTVGCSGSRILFLLTLFKIPSFHTIFWLYAAFPISWILVNIVYCPVILVREKKRFKEISI